MVRLPPATISLLAVASLSSCTLENLKVEACELDDTVGFRISPIDGWVRDYQPRPDELYVRVADGRRYENAVVWATRLNHDDFDKRASRTLIVYGQRILGWETQQQPKPLSRRVGYAVSISDGGHHGRAKFELGKPMPAC